MNSSANLHRFEWSGILFSLDIAQSANVDYPRLRTFAGALLGESRKGMSATDRRLRWNPPPAQSSVLWLAA